ncbi:MAG: FG-GAP-like repeat-containing protein [Verrucomicrobiota bacterium]|nr:FG-GAP-like repeat-containing protein [Verrucomicrobiota bacterium]
MREHTRYENFCRPILERLKKIDGRAPLSIFCNSITPTNPHLQQWLKEGVTIEVHTLSHPCPILANRNFTPAMNTYHGGVDLLNNIPNNLPVAFRTPCCDSQNTPSPRVFSELLMQNNPAGQFLEMDTSVFNIFTSADKSLPASLLTDTDGKAKFEKYIPFDSYVVTIENYPYPYAVGSRIWEMPCMVPSDWEAQHLLGNSNPVTVEDWKAAIDATVLKQGVFNFVFHPHGWVKNTQMIDWIDHITENHGNKVKFLNFREARERLTKNLLGGQPLRAENGQDNGVRLLDLNNDGFMDAVIGNEQLQQTRLWNPQAKRWKTAAFPFQLVQTDADGKRTDAGARFGVLQASGNATILISNGKTSGVWHFDGSDWRNNQTLGQGLEIDGQALRTTISGRDNGVRLRDIDVDGMCEIIVSNPRQQAVLKWNKSQRRWQQANFNLPKNVHIVRDDGSDNGVRFEDINKDGHLDVIHSNEVRYSFHLYVPQPILGWGVGWTREVMSGLRSDGNAIPMIVRGGEHNSNGAWFHSDHLWVQNEDTAHLPNLVDRRSFDELLRGVMPLPKSPEESTKAIETLPGYKVELMVSEPLVMDPVAFEWDEHGRLWVVEMADYPLGLDDKGKPGGRIRILEDRDGDSRYDRTTIFLDDLPYPSGVMPWRDGALVSATPNILFARDTNGDGTADETKVLFTGFGEGNQQHRMNGFEYGLDNWVYAANGDSGGTIRSPGKQHSINIRGRDFRFNPNTLAFDTQAGQTQFGRRRDDWGNWFGNNNSFIGWNYPFPEHYIRRNPQLTTARNRQTLGNYNRSHLIKSISQPVQRFNLVGTAKHITAGNSPTPYRDELFDKPTGQLLFVSAPAYNVVRREVLTPDRLSFKSSRPEGANGQEFIASRDAWFRPIMLKTGPDGALWIADFYRLVLEHPEWIPNDVERKLQLRAGSDRGRLYRVFPANKIPRPFHSLAVKTVPELVAALDSPSGWQRDTAQRLLVDRGDASAVPHLAKLLKNSDRPTARLHALCTLDGLKQIQPEHIRQGLEDRHPGVREHAIRVAESLFRTGQVDDLDQTLAQAVSDSDPRVLAQMAFSLGEWKSPIASRLLGRLAMRSSGDPDLQTAIASSASDHSVNILKDLINEGDIRSYGPLTGNLLALAGAEASTDEIKKLLLNLTTKIDKLETWRLTALSALLENAQKRNLPRSELGLDAELLDSLKVIVENHSTETGDRVAALRLLTNIANDAKQVRTILHRQLGALSPTPLFDLALDELNKRDPATAPLLTHWKSYSPNRKNRVLQHILNDEKKTLGLLFAIDNKLVLPAEIGTAFRQLLKQHSNKTIRGQATAHFGRQNTQRDLLVADRLAKVNSLKGDAASGELLFTTHCTACHKLGNTGNAAGPDLAAITDKSPRALLSAILNPNQAVEDRFSVYALVTKDGTQLAGMISSEGANSVALMDLNGQQRQVLRTNIQSLTGLGRSLMPEGFEQVLNNQQLADLIAHINASAHPPKSFPGNKPTLVKENEGGALSLTAATAEIYGDSLVFEEKYSNLGFWRAASDRATWSIKTKRAGVYDVHLNWALDGKSKVNRIQLRIGQNEIVHEVDSTGTWDQYKSTHIGIVELDEGDQRAIVQAVSPISGFVIDLNSLKLIRKNN